MAEGGKLTNGKSAGKKTERNKRKGKVERDEMGEKRNKGDKIQT